MPPIANLGGACFVGCTAATQTGQNALTNNPHSKILSSRLSPVTHRKVYVGDGHTHVHTQLCRQKTTWMHTSPHTHTRARTRTHTSPSSSFYGQFSSSAGELSCAERDSTIVLTGSSAAPLQPAALTATILCNSFLWVQRCIQNTFKWETREAKAPAAFTCHSAVAFLLIRTWPICVQNHSVHTSPTLIRDLRPLSWNYSLASLSVDELKFPKRKW